jgi:nucleotide-binding universal stress UspA family protein
LNIAAFLKSDLKLVNAYLDPMGTPQTYLESYSYQLNIDKVIREVEEETARSLAAMADRMKEMIREKKIKGVSVSYDLFKGNAVDVIINEINEYKPGLVVMGTRGNELEGIRSFGSVTAQMIDKATVPVLAVPKDYNARDFKTFERVLYATNFDETDFKALRRLAMIIRPFGAKLYCVHAALEEASEMDEEQLRNMRRYLYDSMDEYKIECGLLETMDAQQGLEDFIEEQEIDVLAVTTQKRNFITRIFRRSMTRKFLFHAHIPLLIFRAQV